MSQDVQNVTQKLLQTFRLLLPATTTLFFILLGALAWPLPFFGAVAPSLGLVGVYYWAIYRPDLFRPPIVFLLGLANDAVQFLPLGLSAFVFVAVYQLAFAHRRYFVGQIFYMLWSGFGLVTLIAAVAQWIVLSLIEGQALSLLPIFLQLLLTAAVFPLPAWALITLQRLLLTGRD